jgi:hypothetical protein
MLVGGGSELIAVLASIYILNLEDSIEFHRVRYIGASFLSSILKR